MHAREGLHNVTDGRARGDLLPKAHQGRLRGDVQRCPRVRLEPRGAHLGHEARTHPFASINCSLAIHRFDSANSVTICAVFFTKPR